MDVKNLLMRRGEWLVVVIVLLVALFQVWGGLSDVDARPSADAAKIGIEIKAVEEATGRPPPRALPRQPSDSRVALRERLAVQAEAPRLAQWLNAHPDYFERLKEGNRYLYAYVVQRPTVRIEAEIGSIELAIDLPEPKASSDDRLRIGGTVIWEREVPGSGLVVNAMRPLAIEVQQRIGDEPWAPLAGIGLLRLEEDGVPEPLVIDNIQSMQQYGFRARLIYGGTGYVPDIAYGNDVVVLDALPSGGLDWAQLASSLDGVGAHLDPSEHALPVEAGWSLYAGPWTDPVEHTTEADFRLGLTSISIQQGEEAVKKARISLRRLLRGPAGEQLGWTPVVDFTIAIGERLGEEVDITVPWAEGRKVRVDLRTDLVLEEIVTDIERILYYEVREERQSGEIQLELRPKTKLTQVARLRNVSTGVIVELPRLERIYRRANQIIYPELPEGVNSYRENSGLEDGDPDDYRPPRLRPKEPVWHDADDALLRQVDPLAHTNQPFIEFPDGRIVYYDDINDEVYVKEQAGDEPDDEAVMREAVPMDESVDGEQ